MATIRRIGGARHAGKRRDQLELFLIGSLRQLVPDDHVLARVDRVLDLSRTGVDDGRPGIDPEVAVRLMLRPAKRHRCMTAS